MLDVDYRVCILTSLWFMTSLMILEQILHSFQTGSMQCIYQLLDTYHSNMPFLNNLDYVVESIPGLLFKGHFGALDTCTPHDA